MEERSQSLKRKRESDYPRVTFTTGARTFDRLLKENTLDGLKEGVRKKLGYASDVPLQFAQLRDGKAVDLEDDDDFEAFCAAASSSSVVTVQVHAPPDAPRFTPANTTPLPPSRPPSVESPKKKKKRRKNAATEDKPEETAEASEKPGQKRKAPAAEAKDKAPEAEENDAPPAKKRKKKNAATQEAEAQAATNEKLEPGAVVDEPTGEEEKEAEETEKVPKKRKKSKKSAAAAEEPVVPDTAEQEKEDAVNAKGKGKKKEKATEKAKEASKEKEAEKEKVVEKLKEAEKEKEKATTKAKGKEKESVIGKFKGKELAAEKEAKSGATPPAPPPEVPEPSLSSSSSSSDSDSDDDTPLTKKVKTAAPAKPAAKVPVVNGKTKETKAKEKGKKEKQAESTEANANSTAPPPEKPVEPSGKKSKGTKKQAKEVPALANKAEILASMDVMLAAKRATAAEKEKSGEGLVAPTPPKEKAAAIDKLAKERVVSAAPKKPVATNDSSESEEEEEVSEPAPTVSAGPSTKSSRRSRSDVCLVCGAKPPHPHSRCNIVRQSSSANKRFLKTLQAEQAASPTPFREAQIKTVEELIKEKEIKEKEEAKKKEAKKGGSDEGDVVTGIDAAPSAVSATIVTTTATTETTTTTTKTKTKNKEKEPEKKPGGPASHILSNISASRSRLVYTPPAEDDHTGASATAGPPPARQEQQRKRKQASSASVATSRGPSGSQQPPPPSPISSKPKPIPKTTRTRTRKESSSESSESSEGESPPISKSKPSANNTASTAPFTTTHIGSDDDLFPSISRSSSSHSSRTVVAPPPPPQYQAQASTKSTKPHPLSQVLPGKFSMKPADSSSDSDDEAEDAAPAATQAPSAFSAGLPDLTNVSLADMDLDAVIRGPRGSISTKQLIPSSDSDEDEDEDASVEAEGLVEDDEPKVSRRVSRMFNVAAGGSSEEEESDEEEDEAEEEDESRQPSLEHGDLSFGDVNGMASSVEIDEQGDRAFSEALADDTAVFKIAASNVEENSPESSGPSTPEPAVVEDQSEEAEQEAEEGEEEREEEEEEEEIATAKPGKDYRDDSIEPFDSPVKMQARPRSPIVDADLPQPTPRGLRSRMKARTGKAPEVTPTLTPRSSFQDAMKLLEGVGKAEKRKKEKAKKEAAAAATAASQQTPPAEPEEEEEPEKPVRGKRAAAAKSAKLSSQDVKPLSTRSQKALAATQPAPSVKPRVTRLSKPAPATQPVPVVTPGRTTRAAMRRAASAKPEGAPAPLPPTHATQESVHKWETLQAAESSSQPDETMNMVDELQSVPEDDGEDLFIASETQQSFPYSQWQPQMHSTVVKGKKELHFPTEEEAEDVEDETEVLAALDNPTESTTPEKKTLKRIDPKPPKLSEIMHEGRVFETGASVLSQRQNKGEEQVTIGDLVGPLPDEPSDKSESDNSTDSGSEAEKPTKSHIPKGRRAGMRSRG